MKSGLKKMMAPALLLAGLSGLLASGGHAAPGSVLLHNASAYKGFWNCPPKNQRQRRLKRRRLHAAGCRKAFA